MKLNCDQDSPFHWALHFHRGLKILLDGEEVQFVVEADDKQGYLIRHPVDVNDRLIVDGDLLRIERIEGRVEFVGERRV